MVLVHFRKGHFFFKYLIWAANIDLINIIFFNPFDPLVIKSSQTYTLKNSALYLRVISMSYSCKSWQLFEPNVQNCFGLIVQLLSTKKRPKSCRPSRYRNTLWRQLILTPNALYFLNIQVSPCLFLPLRPRKFTFLHTSHINDWSLS